MSFKQPKQRISTPLGNALVEYLQKHNMQQQPLADYLSIDIRTLKRWISGDTILRDIHELKRMANLLSVDPESLVIATLNIPPTPEQIDTAVDRAWSLINEARISEARALIEKLVLDTVPSDNPILLRSLIRAYHATAFAASLNVRTNEVSQAIYHYKKMEELARVVGDDTYLNIALSYQGDMLRRRGDMNEAIEYLEEARDMTPQADTSARGNGIQLLGRAYFSAGDIKAFEYAMGQAKDLSYAVDLRTGSTALQFHPGTVYEEYGKSYGRIGKVQQALDYIDLAEKERAPTKTSEILMKVARAEILIRSGDIREGQPLAVEAANYSRAHGHYRRLERIYSLKRYLSQQAMKYSKAEMAISEALEGPTED